METGVLKKLSLAGIAKLSRLTKLTKVCLASADYHGLRAHNRLVYRADSIEQYETPGVSQLSLAERG
jgi:hypothetical protein